MTSDNTAIEAATPLFADAKGREVVAPDFGRMRGGSVRRHAVPELALLPDKSSACALRIVPRVAPRAVDQ